MNNNLANLRLFTFYQNQIKFLNIVAVETSFKIHVSYLNNIL